MGTPWETVLSLADEVRDHYGTRHPQSDRSATADSISSAVLTNDHRCEGLKQHGSQFSQETE